MKAKHTNSRPQYVKRFDPNTLFRDKVIEREKLTILSPNYVLEHGREYDDDIDWDGYGYRICDLSGEEEVPITGMLYELYDNGNPMYYVFYEKGLRNGAKIEFYLSGELQSYHVYEKGILVGKSYKWYENGMIKEYVDRIHNKRIEADEQGNITKQGKAD